MIIYYIQLYCVSLVIVKSKTEDTTDNEILKVQQSSTNGSHYASLGCDGDMETFSLTHSGLNQLWSMTLKKKYKMNLIFANIAAGTYELHITTDNALINSSTLCKTFSRMKQQQTVIKCVNAIIGDTIVVKKIDEDSLRLFELYPIEFSPNQFGRNKSPANCLDFICDHKSGACNGCKEGFKRKHCVQEMTSLIISTDLGTPKDGDNVDQALLWSMLVLAILVAVVIILFVHSKKKGNLVKEKAMDNDIIIEFHRGISTYESDFVDIVEDDSDDVEEEVITVEYNNLTSQRVSINQFIEDLPNKKNDGALKREFNDLPNGLLESYSNALKSFNRIKNRYKGIYPYDHNYVKLEKDEDDTEGYINASYIHGFGKEKAYIAAQGPFNQKTVEDFWKVVWQNDCTRIVMLTNLYEGDKKKCQKYWPDTELEIGPFTVKLVAEDVNDQYSLRYMFVQYKEEVKRVIQFHFMDWPDNSVPEDMTSLINFRDLIRNGLTSSDGPIVVHCSAGIGRTGTFIALDYLLEEGAVEQTVDVKGYVISLRHQRGKSIQTYEQYVFLHDAVVEGFTKTIGQQSCLSVL